MHALGPTRLRGPDFMPPPASAARNRSAGPVRGDSRRPGAFFQLA